MFVDVIILALALSAVVKASGWFLTAAEKIGVSLRLPPFILGVLLVGFGTSLPELSTSLAAVMDGVDNVSIANITGSNIANVLLIIGVSTIALGTIRFDKNLIDLDIPLLAATTALFGIMLVDGSLSRVDGIMLLIGFVGYVVYSISYKEDKEYHKGLVSLVANLSKKNRKKIESKQTRIGVPTYAAMVGSLAILAIASRLAVSNLLDIADQVTFGADVLSFFALAIGTSLPELIVSIKSLKAGKGDIVVGNIIGSSMFNMLLIGGSASILADQRIDSGLIVWSLTGMGLSVLLISIGSISKRIHIWEGLMYALIYLSIAGKILEV